ncbi:homeodomain transcription factor ste12 [Maudiozyma exigua]|uniref:Homeodomain transcription factor ste12 n=1 Tax=Maudiozyma exigua TaxID=34358 RepID=A0A9P6W9Q9_MAUEX|nr:homeodomain transcription factor ste12 [Kazachstania exigua]
MIPVELAPSENTHTDDQENTQNGISTLNATVTHLPPHSDVETALTAINDLKFFLATAPVNWQENQVIRRYYLNSELGFVSCICWNKLFYITGTDIVKVCQYMMQNFGRHILHKKKFEEGIFSDLRNLKCGIDAILEQPKSEFLSFLFKNMCLKTQKKQKVFFWFSVPHEKLFSDALERDLKRETLNQQCCTRAIGQPAISFRFNFQSAHPLFQQLQSFFTDLEKMIASGQTLPRAQIGEIEHPDNIQPPLHKVEQQFSNNASSDTQQTGKIIQREGINGSDASIPTPIQDSKKNLIDHEKEERVLPSNNSLQAVLANNNHNYNNINEDDRLMYKDVPNANNSMYETSAPHDIHTQKIVIENTNSPSDETEFQQDHAQPGTDNLIQDTDAIKDEDFPLDYFPVSIEYPNKQEIPENEFQPPLPNMLSPVTNISVAPILSHAGFEGFGGNMSSSSGPVMNVSSGATISEEDSIPNIPNNLDTRYSQEVLPYGNAPMAQTPAVMTTRDNYNSNRRRTPTSPRPSYQTHRQQASFSTFGNTQRAVSGDITGYDHQDNSEHEYANQLHADAHGVSSPIEEEEEERVPVSNHYNNGNHTDILSGDREEENNDIEDDIQYEIQEQPNNLQQIPMDARKTSSSQVPQQMAPQPQNVYGNQMYSSFFYPLPYNNASQEFVNYEQGNYFPEDYLHYKDQQDGHPQYGSIHDFQGQQYGQSAYPYQTPQASTMNSSWNILPPEALQPAQPGSSVLPKSSKRYQFTLNHNTSNSNNSLSSMNGQPNSRIPNGSTSGSRVSSTVLTKFPQSNSNFSNYSNGSGGNGSTASKKAPYGRTHGHSRSLSSNKISKPLHTKASKYQIKLNNSLTPQYNNDSGNNISDQGEISE